MSCRLRRWAAIPSAIGATRGRAVRRRRSRRWRCATVSRRWWRVGPGTVRQAARRARASLGQALRPVCRPPLRASRCAGRGGCAPCAHGRWAPATADRPAAPAPSAPRPVRNQRSVRDQRSTREDRPERPRRPATAPAVRRSTAPAPARGRARRAPASPNGSGRRRPPTSRSDRAARRGIARHRWRWQPDRRPRRDRRRRAGGGGD